MNKLGYQPLPVILRAEPSDARWISNSTKFLRVVATLGALFALCGAVVICLIGFSVFRTRKPDSKATVNVPILPTTTMAPATDASQDNGTVSPLPDPDQGRLVPALRRPRGTDRARWQDRGVEIGRAHV